MNASYWFPHEDIENLLKSKPFCCYYYSLVNVVVLFTIFQLSDLRVYVWQKAPVRQNCWLLPERPFEKGTYTKSLHFTLFFPVTPVIPVLNLYLELQEELFNYIHNILSMPGYSSEEKQCVWVKALQHIKVSQTRLQMLCPLEHTPGKESSGFRKLISDPNLIRPFSLSSCSVNGLCPNDLLWLLK